MFLLEQVQFRYSLHNLRIRTLIFLLALLFLPTGVWFGREVFLKRTKKQSSSFKGVLPEISKREKEVLGLICQGLSNQEIADRLFISLATVKSHVSNLFVKFGMKRRTQLIHFCRENGLFP